MWRYTANKWFGIPSGMPVWNILKSLNLWCSSHQSVPKYLTEALRFDFDFAPQKVKFWRNSSVNKKITAKWNPVGRNHWKNINAHCIRTRHESCPLQQIPMLFPQSQGQTEEANQAFILLRRLGSQKKQISSNQGDTHSPWRTLPRKTSSTDLDTRCCCCLLDMSQIWA